MSKESAAIDPSLLAGQEEAAPARASFAERTILRLLDDLPLGCLHLHTPDGRHRVYGHEIPGTPPARIHIHNTRFFRRMLLNGEVGFGETYVDGDWDTEDLTRLLAYFLLNLEHFPGISGTRAKRLFFGMLEKLNAIGHKLRRNTKRNSRRNIRAHYDLSNAFYQLWLDESWTYSSAYFETPEQALPEAQEAKYRRLAQKLDLRPDMHVLEIGCGWGGFALHLAREHGVRVTGLTISREQLAKGRERVEEAGLAERVDLRFCDYRDMTGQFDAIVSVEMLEAVGHEFLGTFFGQCSHLLKPEGRLGLQVILMPDKRYRTARRETDWIKTHIFPGGQLPSLTAIQEALSRTGDFILHHAESFGLHYAKTLALWHERFRACAAEVRALGFDEAFLRKWSFYLSYCEAAFAMRNITVSQLVFARPNNTQYHPPGEVALRDIIPW
jgi:cyclopropane-fatty-acyl-phospholipid synthase